MRRVLACALFACLILSALPGPVNAAAQYGPVREMLVTVLKEHPDEVQNWFYLDLENNRLTTSAQDADLYFTFADGQLMAVVAGKAGDPGVRIMGLSHLPFAELVNPPTLIRVQENISDNSVLWIRTRSGLHAKLQVLKTVEKLRGFTGVDALHIRYAVEGDTTSRPAGDSGTTDLFFAGARVLELGDLARGPAYVDLDLMQVVAERPRGEFYYFENQLFHASGAGFQRLGEEVGFSRKETVFRTGWEHGVPALPDQSYVFRTDSGAVYKVKVFATAPYKLTLLVAAATSNPPPAGHENLPATLLSAMSAVAVGGDGSQLALDLLDHRPVPADKAHVVITKAGVTAGQESRGVRRISSLADLGRYTDYSYNLLAASPGDLFAVVTKTGPIIRIRILTIGSSGLAVQVLPLASVSESQTALQVPIEIADPDAARLDLDPLNTAHIPPPQVFWSDPSSGGAYVPAGFGNTNRIGYTAGTVIFTGTAGLSIDPVQAVAAPGGDPDLRWDGVRLRALVSMEGISLIGGGAPEATPAPWDDGKLEETRELPGRQTLLAVRTDKKAAMIRVSERGDNPVGWARLHVYFQPDGSRLFFVPAELPPPPPPPEPEETIIKLQLGSAVATINGRPVTLDTPAQSINSRTMVPLRFIAEAFGATVGFENTTKTITISLEGTTVVMVVGNPVASVSGKAVVLDSPPTVVNNRTLVPLRFIAEAFGARVEWDNTTKTATITR